MTEWYIAKLFGTHAKIYTNDPSNAYDYNSIGYRAVWPSDNLLVNFDCRLGGFEHTIPCAYPTMRIYE